MKLADGISRDEFNCTVADMLGFRCYPMTGLRQENGPVTSVRAAWEYPKGLEDFQHATPECQLPDFLEILEWGLGIIRKSQHLYYRKTTRASDQQLLNEIDARNDPDLGEARAWLIGKMQEDIEESDANDKS